MKPIVLAYLTLIVSLAAAGLAQADTEMYRVTFDAEWSAATHPTDFPATAHLSGLIGGSHTSAVTFWALGGLASAGIESMAETGQKPLLTDEVNAAITAGDAYALLSGGGINPSPGSVQYDFTMDSAYPLVTLVSMIAPSPDWFVGVSGLPLHDGNGWQNNVLVDLWPYDAGTDSGVTFDSANADTNPQDPIAQITGYPFTGTPRIGTFTFTIIPEPGTLALLVVGGMLALRRRKRTRNP